MIIDLIDFSITKIRRFFLLLLKLVISRILRILVRTSVDPIRRNSLNQQFQLIWNFLPPSKWNVHHNRSLPFVIRSFLARRKIFSVSGYTGIDRPTSECRKEFSIGQADVSERAYRYQWSRVSVVQAHQEQLEIIARRVLKGRRISILSQFKYLSAVYSGFFS